MSAKQVLVVDDDPIILEVVARALETSGVEVSTARRVVVARGLMQRRSFDLVVTDARMPGESGLCLARHASELGIPCILMSGDPEWAVDHGLARGSYLAKPFEMAALLQIVDAALGGRAPAA